MAEYKIEITTGNKDNAGTDANVSLVIHGSKRLYGNGSISSKKSDFEKNCTNVFTIQTPDLGNIEYIEIGHDNSGKKPGWYLEKVKITNVSDGQCWNFNCNRWLAKDEGDGSLKVCLYPKETAKPYEVTVITGSREGAGTNANVYLSIKGSNLSVSDIHLDDPKRNDFERGSTDKFTLNLPDLGDIQSIKIRHDDKDANWFLNSISIRRGKKVWNFEANRWLSTKDADKKLEATLYPVVENGEYFVTVYTGDVGDGGTDSPICISLYGSNQKSALNIPLDNPDKDDFERGRYTTFTLHLPDLGEINKIKITRGKDDDKWFLDGVKIVHGSDVWHFPVYDWVTSKEVVRSNSTMAHYQYINTYPKKSDNSLRQELNGVAHDKVNGKSYWFFTQNMSAHLWKIPFDCDLEKVFSKNCEEKGITKIDYGNVHLGDIDCYENYLFVPVNIDDGKRIQIDVFSTSDITKKVASQEMYKVLYHNRKADKVTKMDDCGWVAIKDGLLYTSNGDLNATSPILVYKIDLEKIKNGCNDFLKPYANLYVKDEFGDDLTRKCVQGGCFDDENHLHITNGHLVKPLPGKNNFVDSKGKRGGISVFDIPTFSEGAEVNIRRRTNSNQTHDFRYQFNGDGDEPEGITFCRMGNKNKAPGITGQLHVLMLTNHWMEGRYDVWSFKHYKKV